jgi:Zn-dependent peptidase ImmA (M78 family)
MVYKRGAGKAVDAIALSRKVLDWAARLAGQSLESFAFSVAKRDRDRKLIIEGKLTARQAERLAKAARIPFGYLFLSEPPEISRPTIPDLRQTQDVQPLSEDFFDVLEDALAKQEWFVEYLEEHGAQHLSFVGKFSAAERPTAQEVATEIVRELDLSDLDRRQSQDPESYFSRLSAKAEAKGIMVLKSGHVRSFTKRTLSEKEFRGFALPNPVAPLVFVNGNDAKVAAVFTLMHEIAHIWLGIEGVSDVALKNRDPIERLCNAVAANILVPIDRFNEMWSGPQDLVRLAKHFRVSRLVIARRALDQKFVDQAFYDEVSQSSIKAKKAGNPTIDLTIPVRNGKRFTRTVLASAMGGELLLRDAATLLNVRADTVASLGNKVRKAGGGKRQ